MTNREPDTSDIPEVGEEWFENAKLIDPASRALLNDVGLACFPDQDGMISTSAFAEALGMNSRRNLQRMLAGTKPIPQGVREACVALLEKRLAALKAALAKVTE